MPSVDVEFVGPIRRPWREQRRAVVLDEGARVEDLIQELGYSESEQQYLTVLVNAERATLSATLSEGDAVVVTLIVGGGSP